ncbi:MAG TPA: FliM/FliN family flagellar motor C-terminal domain-containing protein [Candidatus Polarisedimenticolia bacterium]|nr:FliM/FliN family flagellar motor C-terminal domain-containing protein [Candidatus Polarisedimenticolia bacterium]
MSQPNPKDPRSRYAGFERLLLRVVVRVGTHRCRLGRLARLKSGEVIALDQKLGTPFDLLCGDVALARVEPVAGEQGIGVKVVEIAVEDRDGSR